MVDDDRFEAVWAAHGAHISRFCAFSAGSKEAGQDLAAETFAKFLTHGGSVTEDRTEAWLFTVARNLCTSHHRSAGRERRLKETLAEDAGHGPGFVEGPGSSVPDPALAAALQSLGDAERLAVYLRVVEERPYSEVARSLERSEGATRMLVLRSLRRLKTALAPTRLPAASASEGDAQHA